MSRLRLSSLLALAILSSFNFRRAGSVIMLTPGEMPQMLTRLGKTKQNTKNWRTNSRLAERRGSSRPIYRGK
jgi:hypothetical protein